MFQRSSAFCYPSNRRELIAQGRQQNSSTPCLWEEFSVLLTDFFSVVDVCFDPDVPAEEHFPCSLIPAADIRIISVTVLSGLGVL